MLFCYVHKNKHSAINKCLNIKFIINGFISVGGQRTFATKTAPIYNYNKTKIDRRRLKL